MKMLFRATLASAALGLSIVSASAADPLKDGFLAPPASAKPLVLWDWMNGCVSEEGITRDLESFQRVGLGGVQQFLVGGSEASVNDPSVQVLNPKFRSLVRYTVAEAKRLGLSFGTHNCPGWSASGGPWVQPDDAMQKLIWSETLVDESTVGQIVLPRGATDSRWNYYKDVAVLAYPVSEQTISIDQVLDLSKRMAPTGSLDWKVPPGKWRILRFGHTLTGATNGTAPESGMGLEVDKMNRAAVERFFAAYPAQMLAEAASDLGSTFKRIELDSYEAGDQTWTSNFPHEFKRIMGYDVVRLLPVLAGAVIDGHDHSNRFLEDWHATIAQLFKDNYFATLHQLINRGPGVQFLLEPYATGPHEPFQSTEIASEGDILMCEFWSQPSTWGWDSIAPVVSAAHTNAKTIVAAEAFTGQPQYAWRYGPYDLKTTGDRAFASGVNLFYLHAAAHSPWPDLLPGMTMGWWGTQFGPGQTWWEHGGREWIQYLTRCQYMLQQGLPVVDICYLGRGRFTPVSIPGYSSDVIGEDAFLHRTQVKDGKLTLSNGQQYSVLVLPAAEEMDLEVAKQLVTYVKSGLIVVGERPTRTRGLYHFPQGDEDLARLTAHIWQETPVLDKQKDQNQNHSMVHSGLPVASVIKAVNLLPDVEQSEEAALLWTHRRINGDDIYFFSNQTLTHLERRVVLRTENKALEKWSAENGAIKRQAGVVTPDGRVSTLLHLDAAESIFIIARAEATAGDQSDGEIKESRVLYNVGGPWKVLFPPKLGAPDMILLNELASWSEHTQDGVRFFSGTATYQRTFSLSALPERNDSSCILLDLGGVAVTAEVKLNGTGYPALWKPPYVIDVSKEIHVGENQLEIKVTNLWPNRMIGDAHEPEDAEYGPVRTFKYVKANPVIGRPLVNIPKWVTNKEPRPSQKRVTFTTFDFFTAETPLMTSGLLGPVHLLAVKK